MTDPLIPPGVTVQRDVVHTKLPGYRPLCLDLYRPDAGARAVCVYVHGGGWRMGSRREGPGPISPTSRRLFGRLAGLGLAVAAVDYRLSGEARFPSQRDDVQAALRWLRKEGPTEVPGLPLALFGVSAGGQLAALCGLDPEFGARAVALWYPVTDLGALADDVEAAGGEPDRSAASREALMLGTAPADDPALAADASPVHHVTAHAPPFLILHGDADRAVPPRQGERLQDALVAAGGRCTRELVSGYDHMFPGIPDADLEALVDRTGAFLLDPVGGGS